MPGPNPSFADAWTQFGKVIKWVDEQYKYGSENASSLNILDLEDALITALDGKYTPRALEIMDRLARRPVENLFDPSNLQAMFNPFILEIADTIAAPEMKNGGAGANVYDLLSRIREYMVAQGDDLNSRGMTLPTTPSSSSGTGTGTVHCLTTDEDGEPLECTGADTKTWTCEYDQASGGRKHRELFKVTTPRPAQRAYMGVQASFMDVRGVAAVDCKSAGVLQNPSFETHSATTDDTEPASTTDITGWTLSAAASFKLRKHGGTYNSYRGYDGEPSSLWMLEFDASGNLTQTLRSTFPSVNFLRSTINLPWFLQVAWMRTASCTGTLELHLGAQSTTVDVSTGVNGTWNVLFIPMGTKCWYKNFKELDLDVKIVMDSLATGTVLVDDVVLSPFIPLGGLWWLPIGGATAFLKGDLRTFADTQAAGRATFSEWLWRAYGLPNHQNLPRMGGWFPTDNAGGESIADPA